MTSPLANILRFIWNPRRLCQKAFCEETICMTLDVAYGFLGIKREMYQVNDMVYFSSSFFFFNKYKKWFPVIRRFCEIRTDRWRERTQRRTFDRYRPARMARRLGAVTDQRRFDFTPPERPCAERAGSSWRKMRPPRVSFRTARGREWKCYGCIVHACKFCPPMLRMRHLLLRWSKSVAVLFVDVCVLLEQPNFFPTHSIGWLKALFPTLYSYFTLDKFEWHKVSTPRYDLIRSVTKNKKSATTWILPRVGVGNQIDLITKQNHQTSAKIHHAHQRCS